MNAGASVWTIEVDVRASSEAAARAAASECVGAVGSLQASELKEAHGLADTEYVDLETWRVRAKD